MHSLDERRRRAQYRASHRGTREMDWLLGRYADVALSAMSDGDLESFEALLVLPDPDLHRWIAMGEAGRPDALALSVTAIRRYHGLEHT